MTNCSHEKEEAAKEVKGDQARAKKLGRENDFEGRSNYEEHPRTEWGSRKEVAGGRGGGAGAADGGGGGGKDNRRKEEKLKKEGISGNEVGSFDQPALTIFICQLIVILIDYHHLNLL